MKVEGREEKRLKKGKGKGKEKKKYFLIRVF